LDPGNPLRNVITSIRYADQQILVKKAKKFLTKLSNTDHLNATNIAHTITYLPRTGDNAVANLSAMQQQIDQLKLEVKDLTLENKKIERLS